MHRRRGRDWNHNLAYHGFVVSTIPKDCRRALDVGCGSGVLAFELASRCGHVTAIDIDAEVCRTTSATRARPRNVTVVHGDVLDYVFPHDFTFVAAVATLHHLPLEPALARFGALLAPGGALTIVGLYRVENVGDYVLAIAGLAASIVVRRFRAFVGVEAPVRPPTTTFADIRRAAHRILPGCAVKRRLFFRYSIVWRKPLAPCSGR